VNTVKVERKWIEEEKEREASCVEVCLSFSARSVVRNEREED